MSNNSEVIAAMRRWVETTRVGLRVGFSPAAVGWGALALVMFLLFATLSLLPAVCIGFAAVRWNAGLHEDAAYYLLMSIALGQLLRGSAKK